MGLQRGLARGEDGHRGGGAGGGERGRDGAGGGDHAAVAFAELVGQAVDMQVIRPGQTPERGPCAIVEAERGVAREIAPAVPMGVDGQLRMAAQGQHPGEADGIGAGHDAGAAFGQHEVVAAAHLVHLAGQVEGEHDLAARPFGMGADDAHDGAHAVVEGADVAVGLQFVILDEVDARRAERVDHGGGFGGRKADGGFDDGADEGAVFHARQGAGALGAEGGAGTCGDEFGGKAERGEAQARDAVQFEEVPGHGGEDVGQAGAGIGERP